MDSKKRVLVVEDDKNIASQLQERFDVEGFDSLFADNGIKGLELALKEHPDVIILDIMLPGINGMVLLNKLRYDSWGETAPVILYSNKNPDDDMVQSVLDNKPSYYLLKSNTSLDDLVSKIKEITGLNS